NPDSFVDAMAEMFGKLTVDVLVDLRARLVSLDGDLDRDGFGRAGRDRNKSQRRQAERGGQADHPLQSNHLVVLYSTKGSTVTCRPHMKASATRRNGVRSTSCRRSRTSGPKRAYRFAYSRSGASVIGWSSTCIAEPPFESSRRPVSVSISISHVCGPVCRKSNSALTGTPSGPCRLKRAAMGVSQFEGKESSASLRIRGRGRMRVRMDSAL